MLGPRAKLFTLGLASALAGALAGPGLVVPAHALVPAEALAGQGATASWDLPDGRYSVTLYPPGYQPQSCSSTGGHLSGPHGYTVTVSLPGLGCSYSELPPGCAVNLHPVCPTPVTGWLFYEDPALQVAYVNVGMHDSAAGTMRITISWSASDLSPVVSPGPNYLLFRNARASGSLYDVSLGDVPLPRPASAPNGSLFEGLITSPIDS